MIIIIEESTGKKKKMSNVYAMDLIKRGLAKMVDIEQPEPVGPVKPKKPKARRK